MDRLEKEGRRLADVFAVTKRLLIAFVRSSELVIVCRDNVRLFLTVQEFGDDPWASADRLFEPVQEFIEGHLRILLAGQDQKRIDILLAATLCSFLRFVGNKNNGTVVFGAAV